MVVMGGRSRVNRPPGLRSAGISLTLSLTLRVPVMLSMQCRVEQLLRVKFMELNRAILLGACWVRLRLPIIP